MNKPTLVILEGANRSGKSSVFKALLREFDYQLYVLDRFTGSHIVYDKLWNRTEISEEQHFETEESLSDTFDILLVYLHAPLEVLKSRDDAMKLYRFDSFDLIEKRTADLEAIVFYYDKYLAKTKFDNISVDSNKYSVEEIVASIKHRMTNDF